jgi:hypothetical protein
MQMSPGRRCASKKARDANSKPACCDFRPRQDVQPGNVFIGGRQGEREARLAVSGFLKRRQTEKPVRSFFKLRGIR